MADSIIDPDHIMQSSERVQSECLVFKVIMHFTLKLNVNDGGCIWSVFCWYPT